MAFTQNNHSSEERAVIDVTKNGDDAMRTELDTTSSITKSLALPEQLHLRTPITSHHPSSGLNPVVDAAGYIFTILNKLKATPDAPHLGKLQEELVQEINTFQDAIKQLGYNTEYTLVCRYIVCATIDEQLGNTAWGSDLKWEAYSLLSAFNQDLQHGEKFFNIMDRAVKEPAYYIDLMELMYMCLSMGYRGRYSGSDKSQYQLEQVTDALYKQIRAQRGNFSKSLSPAPLRRERQTAMPLTKKGRSPLSIFFYTACLVMVVFIGLGYLMEMISNEAFNIVSQIQATTTKHTPKP